MGSSGPSPVLYTGTCSYVFAFTEDGRDSLLCPLDYYDKGGREFARHRPYAIKHNFRAATWQEAKLESERILREFKHQLLEDEKTLA